MKVLVVKVVGLHYKGTVLLRIIFTCSTLTRSCNNSSLLSVGGGGTPIWSITFSAFFFPVVDGRQFSYDIVVQYYMHPYVFDINM